MTTTVTLTTVDEDSLAGAPAPHIDVLVDSIDVGVSFVTVWRTVNGRALKVRGLVNVASSSAVTARDFEAPFGVECSYRVEQFDSGGLFVSYSAATTATLPSPTVGTMWVHNPLDPSTSVAVMVLSGAASEITRPSSAEVFRIPGRSVGVAITGTRHGVEGVVLDCMTETSVDGAKFDALFGAYDDDTVPILCVRTRPEMLLPPTLFALVASPRAVPLDNRHGGTAISWLVNGDEVAPPAEAIIVALLDYADFTAFYATYAAFTAAYADYTDASRDYTIAGTA